MRRFGLLDEAKAEAMISELAGPDHQTDWGMRIISDHSAKFSGGGYHYGSVWPLFTGWASVGEYRYHRALPAYENLRANALLTFDGSLGHVTGGLSGDYYQPLSTSSPHQIWSAAMVVSPILRGMFGLQTDVERRQITFAPHVPSDWTSFAIRNVRVGGIGVDFRYRKTADSVVLETKRAGAGDCWVEFSPSFSLRTQVVSVQMNGRPLPFKMQPNGNDQHLYVRFPVSGGANNLVVRMKNDFGLALSNELPPLGSASRGLRVLSESWNAARTQLTLEVSGLTGSRYQLDVWNPGQISSVEGATLTKLGKLEIQMPQSATDSYLQQKVVIHFGRS